jgi:hypothetical protein
MKNATSNLALVDRPEQHDIEAVRPHMRKHMRPFRLSTPHGFVTINGTNPADAKKRFKAMTHGSVAFAVAPAQKGKR